MVQLRNDDDGNDDDDVRVVLTTAPNRETNHDCMFGNENDVVFCVLSLDV